MQKKPPAARGQAPAKDVPKPMSRIVQSDEDGHPKATGYWLPGNSAADDNVTRKAHRQIGAVCREAHSPEEVQGILWSIFAGEDPFSAARAEKRRGKNPDKLPVFDHGVEGTIDWKHRMKAGEMWANYAYGKPLQGVVVDAMIQQQNVNVNIDAGPIDPRTLPADVREKLRAVALAALGRPAEPERRGLPGASLASRGRDVTPHADDGGLGESLPAGVIDVSPNAVDRDGEISDESSLGQVEAVGGTAHDQSIGSAGQIVKAVRCDFRDSSNVADAVLDDGVCTVRFRAGLGGPIVKTYRYVNVTPTMMREWQAAPSAGAWFARNIRQRHQQYPVIADTPLSAADPELAESAPRRFPGVVI